MRVPSFQSHLIQRALFSYTGLTAFILFAALWLSSLQTQGAIPVPKIYYEQEIRLGNLRLGFGETARVERREIGGGVIVTGNQVYVFIGPFSGVLPISLLHAGTTALLILFLLSLLLPVLYRKNRLRQG